MKNGREHFKSGGEGRLLAAVLGLVLMFSLFVYLDRKPDAQLVAPVHVVSLEKLKRLEMLEINSASAAELAYLPGIGDALAERIVAYRQAHGEFSSVDDLRNVSGIGEGKLEQLRDLVYIE